MPHSDISIIESCKKFFTERVPDKGGTNSIFGFLGFSGLVNFSDGFSGQINNRFFTITS